MSGAEVAAVLRDEAQFWMDVPSGRPGQTGEQIAPMLLRLADQIESVA